MTEPQELRSIDEIFRNTLNNLPETPAESGWDTPSDRVWQQVRHNIGNPGTGWSLQSQVTTLAIAILVAVGLYFAFSSPEKDALKPVVNSPAPIAAPVEQTEKMPGNNASENIALQETTQRKSVKQGNNPTVRPRRHSVMTNPVESLDNPASQQTRSSGAAPLGTSPVKIPNTTEALKAERALQLEQRWKTPLNLLPVPRTKGANN